MNSSFERLSLATLGALVVVGVVSAALLSWPDRKGAPDPLGHPADAENAGASIDAPSGEPAASAETGSPALAAPGDGSSRTTVRAAPPVVPPAGPEDVQSALINRLVPIVQSLNGEILRDRGRIWGISATLQAGGTLTWKERLFLDVAGDRYGVADDDLAELLRRVDAVPPSLAVAAAAHATDWGRRAARPIPPAGRAGVPSAPAPAHDGADEAGQDALTPYAHAFAHALNTRPEYARFREVRQDMRMAAMPLEGKRLVETLPAGEFASSVKAVVLRHGLATLDDEAADDPAAERGIGVSPL